VGVPHVGEAVEQGVALGLGGARPGVERLLGGGAGIGGLLDRGVGRDPDDLLGGGVDDVVAACGLDLLAPDDQPVPGVSHERKL